MNKAAEPRRKRAMPVGYCEKPASCVAAKSAPNLSHTCDICRFPSTGTLGRAAGYALAERVNAARIFRCALKINGVSENRNARSGVRFLGIRSNKCTRAWRQATRAATPSVALLRRGQRAAPFNRRKSQATACRDFREYFLTVERPRSAVFL